MCKVELSKMRYCKCVQCPKMIWLNKYKPEFAIQNVKESVLKNSSKVYGLAKSIFETYEEIEFDNGLNGMIEKTKELMKNKPNVITNASFNYDGNFCNIDILKNDTDGVEIYEVKSSTEISEIYLEELSYQYYVLSNLGLNVKKVYIIYINNTYIRGEEIEVDKLFNIEDVTNSARAKQEKVKDNIENLNKYMEEYDEKSEPSTDIGLHCFNPYDCEFWGYCTRNLPKPNVFDIAGGMRKDKKFQKYYEGKISFTDLQHEDLNPKYLEQIDFELNNLEPKIDVEAIRNIVDTLKYPLYFVDYETYQLAVPEIMGTKPYQQLPFQYSLHIIEEKGSKIEHKEFLAEVDDKDFIRHFAESLVKDIPENGSVIIYNKIFEATRNNEIARMYPELKDEMERINRNMVDFLEPFKHRKYYVKEMHGSASIKAVLPALYPDDPELDYHNLELVHNGEEASETFLSLKDKPKEEQEKIREELLAYCKLDTYAMVKIWERFKEIIGV